MSLLNLESSSTDPSLASTTFPPELVKAKLAAAIDALAKLDAFLSLDSRKFLLGGENVTLADIAVVSGLVRGYQGVYDK